MDSELNRTSRRWFGVGPLVAKCSVFSIKRPSRGGVCGTETKHAPPPRPLESLISQGSVFICWVKTQPSLTGCRHPLVTTFQNQGPKLYFHSLPRCPNAFLGHFKVYSGFRVEVRRLMEEDNKWEQITKVQVRVFTVIIGSFLVVPESVCVWKSKERLISGLLKTWFGLLHSNSYLLSFLIFVNVNILDCAAYIMSYQIML